jgi:CspA family cold shock protein
MGRGNEHRSRQRQFGAQSADPWGDYAPPPSHDRPTGSSTSRATSGREVEARVKWFNPEKGFGFVELTDGSGEAFLHIRQVEAAGHSNLPSARPCWSKSAQGRRARRSMGSFVLTPARQSPSQHSVAPVRQRRPPVDPAREIHQSLLRTRWAR